MGKTALATKIYLNLLRSNIPVMFVSLEMSRAQLLLRILSILSQIPYRVFKETGARPPDIMRQIQDSFQRVKDMKLLIEDVPGIGVSEIAAVIEAEVHRSSIRVAFVDHMHLINTSGMGNTNAEMYSNISLELKNIARRLNITVVCLAQLSRNLENRSEKRPQLSDLRESGGIEQNADNVWFVHNPAEYSRDTAKKSIQDIELIIAKNKSLETGIVNLRFKGAYMEFTD
jgi:replicative DNA helicase